MKMLMIFGLLFACILGLFGCAQKESVAFCHAVVCPDCGGYRSEDAEFCPGCERNENLKAWLESEKKDESISILIDNEDQLM